MNCEGEGGLLEKDIMSVKRGGSVDIPVRTIPRPTPIPIKLNVPLLQG